MKWSFPACKNGEQKGISDSGVETFAGTPLYSLAREICQNSLDAALKNERPVEIVFGTFDIPINELPDLTTLQDAFDKANRFWPNDQKAQAFFADALEVLQGDSIKILHISDHNTTGLTGSAENTGTSWCNLIKSSGASNKDGASGGSYGIGKFAPFACSSLRTVFYSTLDSDGVVASQGVCRITSFKDDDGNTATGVGYCGAPDNEPTRMQWTLGRDRDAGDSGTDIIIPGFKYSGTDWEDQIIESVLDGFLDAVFRGTLTVNINGRIISEATLPSFFENGKTYSNRAEVYYEILTSPNTEWRTVEDFLGRGKVSLGLMIKQGFHQRVAMIRKTGMKIMDRGHLSSAIPCAGVLRIDGDELNNLLRKMENPQHLKWEPSRLGKNEEKEGKEVRDALYKFPRDFLKELQSSSDTKVIDSDTGEYLPVPIPETADGKDNQVEAIRNTITSVTTRAAPRPTVPDSALPNESDDIEKDTVHTVGEDDGVEFNLGGENNAENSASNGVGSGDENGEGTGGLPRSVKTRKKRVPLSKARVFCNDKTNGKYTLVIAPTYSISDASIEISVVAETQLYDAEVISATTENGKRCHVVKNAIVGVALQKERPAKFDLVLNYKDYCSLEIAAHVHR